MDNIASIENVLESQRNLTKEWHKIEPHLEENYEKLESLVKLNHLMNFKLWHEEDKARVENVPDRDIAKIKRAIDKLNQKRNDLIEKIDVFFLENLPKENQINEKSPLNSETVGSIFDRLSINALKIYHMNEETTREDASQEHKEKCKQKLERLLEQRKDLVESLKQLIEDILSGKRRIKIYRQFKMYNDPESNPEVRASLNKPQAN